MSKQNVNNGAFDNDPSAEKIRLAFDKVKANFDEQYTTLPQLDPSLLIGNNGKILVVDATGTFFELVDLAGGGDMLSTNNLSEVDPAQARLNLGLGDLATQDAANFATSAQGVKADSAVQSVVAGTGITVDITDPLNPIVNNTETNDYVISGVLAPDTGILTLTLFGAGTVDIDLSKYVGLRIDGYEVEKGVGNVDYNSIEVGDFYKGWESATRYVNGKVNALPYSTVGNTDFVIDSEI